MALTSSSPHTPATVTAPGVDGRCPAGVPPLRSRRPPDRMRRLCGALAAIAGASLLTAGATHALWTDADATDPGVLTAGTLDVTVLGAPMWTDISPDRASSAVPDVSGYRMVPGDVLQGQFDVEVSLGGNNLTADLEIAVADAAGPLLTAPHGVDITFTVVKQPDQSRLHMPSGPIYSTATDVGVPGTATIGLRARDNVASQDSSRAEFSSAHDIDPDLSVLVTARFDPDTPGRVRAQQQLDLGDLAISLRQVRPTG